MELGTSLNIHKNPLLSFHQSQMKPRHVALARTDVSGELSSFFIRVTIISELGITLAVIRNTISSQHASVASYS
jgi:hypothetical protein